MPKIFVYVVHHAGIPDDTSFELIAAVKAIDATASPIALVAGSDENLIQATSVLRSSYAEIWKIASEALAYPNAELVRQALLKIIPNGSIVLLPHDHFGIDLAPGLSIKLDTPYVPDVLGIDVVGGTSLRVVRQEFGGAVCSHVSCDISTGAVITVRPGSFKAQVHSSIDGLIVDKSAEIGTLSARRRYLETIVPEAGDVDISKHKVLVSIGRGIQEKENIVMAEELAEALGGAVSCSRPVVDAKWLGKSRQVGSSGKTVMPKVYLACGISGAFQHLAGLKGSPFIVAINKNPKAPIFQVADIGIVDDLLELLPELTTKVRETRGAVAE